MFNTIDSNEPYFKLIESDKIISIDTNLYNIDKLEGENPAVDIKDLKYLNNDRKIIFMIGDASYPYVYYDSDDDTWRLRTSMSGLSNPMGLDMIVRFSYNNMNIESFGCDVPQTTSGDYVVSCNLWRPAGHEPNGDYVVSCNLWRPAGHEPNGDYVVSCNLWRPAGHEPNGDYVVSCDTFN